MMTDTIEIDGHVIGKGHAPFIIAELSANHNGDLGRALQSIESAKACGADAIKLQTYTPDTMTIDCDRADFRIKGGLWDGYTLYELYKAAHTPFEWHEAMFKKSREIGITVFSTPFDETAVDLLEELEAPAYKIASFEVADLALIARVARTGKPMIVSTGMADLNEIAEAVQTARDSGCCELVLLHCVSGYPTPVGDANLCTIGDLAMRFDVPVGLSDHTLGTTVSIAAIAAGATIIEKHFTLDRADGGFDSEFSIEPDELVELVSGTRDAWAALGTVSYVRKKSEEPNTVFRRSLYIVKDIEKGTVLSPENVRCIRPGHGLAPKHLEKVLGNRVARDVTRGTPLDWSLLMD